VYPKDKDGKPGKLKRKVSMHYFIITFRGIVDGQNVSGGDVGTTSTSSDYKPNTVKQNIKDFLKRKYPTSKTVDAVFPKVEEVSEERFKEASKYFFDLS
jgi:hypothetical protein